MVLSNGVFESVKVQAPPGSFIGLILSVNRIAGKLAFHPAPQWTRPRFYEVDPKIPPTTLACQMLRTKVIRHLEKLSMPRFLLLLSEDYKRKRGSHFVEVVKLEKEGISIAYEPVIGGGQGTAAIELKLAVEDLAVLQVCQHALN